MKFIITTAALLFVLNTLNSFEWGKKSTVQAVIKSKSIEQIIHQTNLDIDAHPNLASGEVMKKIKGHQLKY